MNQTNEGYCHCCRSNTTFHIHADWLRDHYVCEKCGTIPRQRHVNHVLDKYLPGWEQRSLHESSPSNDHVRRYCDNYSTSYYFEDVTPGQRNTNGDLCQDLQALTFDDNSFDIIITQDVFEHVLDPAAA